MPGKHEVIGNEGWTGNSEALKVRGRVAERWQSRHMSSKSGKKIKVELQGLKGDCACKSGEGTRARGCAISTEGRMKSMGYT